MADLGEVGQQFYDSLAGAIKKHPEATRALLVEAARSLERLNDLDDVISGKGVLNLLRFRLVTDEGDVAEVKFDHVLSEARQQQANLSALMKVILPNLNEDAGKAEERDFLDEITQRRAARRSSPAKAPSRAKRTS